MKNGNFTEEEIENEKIIYFLGQELTNSNESIEEYKENVRKVTKEQIQNIASKVKVNTIYFLRN